MLCSTIAQGNGGIDSVLRECHNCGDQVLVTCGTLELVERGELTPWCWSCILHEGVWVRLHDAQLHELAAYGRLGDVTDYVSELNYVLDTRARAAAHEAQNQEDEPDNGEQDADHVGDGGQRIGKQSVQGDEHDADHNHDQGVDPRHS
jgi:hypothetical protein